MKKTTRRTRFTPEGWHTVTPRIFVDDSKRFVEFLRKVFDATGEYQQERPSVIKIGDSLVMIGDTAIRNVRTAFLYVYVPDSDATYQRALAAGARSLEAPLDTPYGDQRCMVEDPWGNTWQIATHVRA